MAAPYLSAVQGFNPRILSENPLPGPLLFAKGEGEGSRISCVSRVRFSEASPARNRVSRPIAVGNDAARHIARMSRECNKTIRSERIRIMTVAAGVTNMFATNFAQASLQLTTVERGIFSHRSGGEHKFVAERWRNRAACFHQSFQMRLGGFLKTQNRFAAILSVGVATW